jgi:hypothetical protein
MINISTQEVSFAGNWICIQSNDPEIVSAIEFLFRPHLINPPKHQTPTIDILRVENGYRLILPGDSIPSNIPEDSLYKILSQTVLYHLVDANSNQLMLHAAAVTRDGWGICMLAPTGLGKTTLTSWLLGHGYNYLTDELIAIDGNLNMKGLCRPLNIKASGLGIVEEFNWLASSLAQGTNSQEVTFLPNDNAFLTSISLDLLIFPHFVRDAELQVKSLSVGQCAASIMGGLLNAKKLPKHGLTQATQISESVRGFSVSYGQLSDVSDWLLRELPS